MSYGDSEASSYEGPVESPMRADAELARAAKIARRESADRGPIESALDRCDESAASLAEIAENLLHRLSPILGPDRPEPSLGEVRGSEDSSPLVDRLDRLNDRLTDARATLLRTTRRIEL